MTTRPCMLKWHIEKIFKKIKKIKKKLLWPRDLEENLSLSCQRSNQQLTPNEPRLAGPVGTAALGVPGSWVGLGWKC